MIQKDSSRWARGGERMDRAPPHIDANLIIDSSQERTKDSRLPFLGGGETIKGRFPTICDFATLAHVSTSTSRPVLRDMVFAAWKSSLREFYTMNRFTWVLCAVLLVTSILGAGTGLGQQEEAIVAWGSNTSGQCDVPLSNDNVTTAVGGASYRSFPPMSRPQGGFSCAI